MGGFVKSHTNILNMFTSFRASSSEYFADVVGESRRTHSNRGPLTKEDNRVHGLGKVHSWKMSTKPMGAV